MEADITTGKQYIDEEEERDIEFELNRERRKDGFVACRKASDFCFS